jgi:hypothetical protein
MPFSRKRKTHGFLTHNRSYSALKAHLKRHQNAAFLPYNFSGRGLKGCLHDLDGQEKVWLAATKNYGTERICFTLQI